MKEFEFTFEAWERCGGRIRINGPFTAAESMELDNAMLPTGDRHVIDLDRLSPELAAKFVEAIESAK